MRKLVFSFLVVFSSIAFGQSGFNPPKTKINEPLKVENIGIDTVRVLDSVRVWFEQTIDTTINPTIREIRDSISRQNTILANQMTSTPTLVTPIYSSVRNTFTANTTPVAYNVTVPLNTREISIQNVTASDIQITTSQGIQILATRQNLTISNPNTLDVNHVVFSGVVNVAFFSSVGANISGVQPRVIIDFKAY